ncbi:MAG: ABC transporter ATP-binding protein [Sulfolobales archaeon]
MSYILETFGLVKRFGGLVAVNRVDIKVRRNSITMLIGPNGAGKTTLLNSITGLATIHSGKVYFQDIDITGLPPHKVSRLGLSYVPQMGNVFSNLTVEENLRVAGYMLDQKELLDRLELVFGMFPVLKNFKARRAGTLSGGERRMLAIGMGLMKKPKVMLLDEVTTDLAPIYVKKVLEKVVELRDELKISVILVEQYAIRALQIADKAYLLVSGTIRYEGNPQDLLSHREFSKLYLGIS